MSKGEGKTLVIGEPVDENELRENGHAEERRLVDAPRIGDPSWGLLGLTYRTYKKRRKEKKYADKGYVKWYLVGSGWPDPKFVKPEGKGGGIPETKHDDQTYLFPKEAALPDRDSGMFTVVHKEGEADPLKLTDPTEHAIKADELSEYLTKRVTSSPPGFFDKFDFDPEDLLYIAIAAIILIAAFQQVMGGGF